MASFCLNLNVLNGNPGSVAHGHNIFATYQLGTW